MYKLCKFCKNLARDTPLQGVYSPHFGQILIKISVLGVLYPYLCTDGGEIWHEGADCSSVPNFTPIGVTLPFHCILNGNYYHWWIFAYYFGHLGGHLGFWKSHKGGKRPPGLNFKHILKTIKKCIEMIVNRPCKVSWKCGVVPLD